MSRNGAIITIVQDCAAVQGMMFDSVVDIGMRFSGRTYLLLTQPGVLDDYSYVCEETQPRTSGAPSVRFVLISGLNL